MKKMKQHNIYTLFAFGAIACLLAACSQEEAVLDNPIEELQTYTLYLDADVPDFDTETQEETRASGNSWEDGDVIYVTYSNDGNKVVSNAIYKSNLRAFQFSATSLKTISDASCSIYYFRGGSFSISEDTVTLDKFTAIFTDPHAVYTCSNNVINISAEIKPYTWRLSFKGTAGKQMKLRSSSGIVFNSSLNLKTGSFLTKTDSEILQVQADGYTTFVYGLFIDTNITIEVGVGGSTYSRTLNSSKLAVGESGYFNIPTTSNLYGWTKRTLSSGSLDGHDYVDLGLPSGTLWATCDIGAFTPEENGSCYAWGETEEKSNYDEDSYIFIKEHDFMPPTYDITGTEYDVAHVKWGGSWCMPSRELIKELVDNCLKEEIIENDMEGILITGPNGNSIFLPGRYVESDGVSGSYWSSSCDANLGAYCFSFISGYCEYWEIIPAYFGLPVRAVIPGQMPNKPCPVAEAIDLGLPSGTKWASWNIGASSPEEYGGYYAWGDIEERNFYTWSASPLLNSDFDISGTEYDVAHVKWGDSWCMPSNDQINELVKYCSMTWIKLNEVYGVLVKGINGASIFLPAAGRRESDYLELDGQKGFYWSSSHNNDGQDDYYALGLFFDSSNWSWDSDNLFIGRSVRAIIPGEKPINLYPVAEAIDLGLPSGTKWASWNVGASSPEENGCYFAWGETEIKDIYDWSSYIYSDGTEAGCLNIGSDIAGTQYDVAHRRWGGSWRMPSVEQCSELVRNSTKTMISMNGVRGLLVTGPNGESIFLPQAGMYVGNSFVEGGFFWTSSLLDIDWSQAMYMAFYGNETWLNPSYSDYRSAGLSVRAVCP